MSVLWNHQIDHRMQIQKPKRLEPNDESCGDEVFEST